MRRLFLLKKGDAFAEQPPFKTTGTAGTQDKKMIIYFAVNLNKLVALGRKYPWSKPKRCLNCNGCRIWGHGFVLAWFDGFDQAIEIKRCRCPDCKCIFRFRPEGFFKRFQADTATIRSSIFLKVHTGKWMSGISRTRQCHWFRALLRKIRAYLTDTWAKGILAAFDELIKFGLIPVSRSI
jgi:hypothetical protein